MRRRWRFRLPHPLHSRSCTVDGAPSGGSTGLTLAKGEEKQWLFPATAARRHGVRIAVPSRSGGAPHWEAIPPEGPLLMGGRLMTKLVAVLAVLASVLFVAPVIESGTSESTQIFQA